MVEAIENIVRIIEEGCIHDARFEEEFLKLLKQRAGDNAAALCREAIDNLAESRRIVTLL